MIWLPNALSLIRVPLVIVGLYLIHNQGYSFPVFLLFMLAIVTDYLDGYFARVLNATGESGKILDPLADKIVVVAVAIYCVMERGLPFWFFAMVVTRDILIVIGGIILVRKTDKIEVSLTVGKYAVGFISLSLLAYLFPWSSLRIPLLLNGIFWVIISFAIYTVRFVGIWRKNLT